jgi:hypothetical protein
MKRSQRLELTALLAENIINTINSQGQILKKLNCSSKEIYRKMTIDALSMALLNTLLTSVLKDGKDPAKTWEKFIKKMINSEIEFYEKVNAADLFEKLLKR